MRIDDPLAQQRVDQTPLMSVPRNPRSRDETIKMMRSLQAVSADVATRQAILALSGAEGFCDGHALLSEPTINIDI